MVQIQPGFNTHAFTSGHPIVQPQLLCDTLHVQPSLNIVSRKVTTVTHFSA